MLANSRLESGLTGLSTHIKTASRGIFLTPVRSSRPRFARLLSTPWYVEFSAALRAALSPFLVRSFLGYLARGGWLQR